MVFAYQLVHNVCPITTYLSHKAARRRGLPWAVQALVVGAKLPPQRGFVPRGEKRQRTRRSPHQRDDAEAQSTPENRTQHDDL